MTMHTTHTSMNSYRATQVQTASPGDLLIMLYDGAIRFINQGLACIEKKDHEGAHNAIVRAEKIITELMVTLDLEKGGEIAKNLHSLYCFMKLELVSGNLKKSSEPLENVRELIKGLRDTWIQVIKKNSSGAESDDEPVEAVR